jgi:membrane protein
VTTTEPPGRRSGATADDPTDIPSRGWRQILRRTKDEIKDDRVTLMAAGMAFYAMLALFPALAAAITIWGLVADPAQVQRTIADAAQALPSGAADLLSEQMTRIADSSGTALGWTLVATLAGALWSASSGTKGMMEAVNAAYDEDETRGFVRVRGMALALTLGGIFFGLLLVGLVAVVPGVLSLIGLGSLAENLVRWGRWPVLAVVLALGLAVIYRYAPDRDQPRWRWMTPGSIAAVVLWLVASAGFAWYVNSFGSYSETYGSIAGVIVLMLWFFISALAVLVGAELNAEVERQPRGAGMTDDSRQIDLRDPDAAQRPVRSGPS